LGQKPKFYIWIPVFTGMTISMETPRQSLEEFFSIKMMMMKK